MRLLGSVLATVLTGLGIMACSFLSVEQAKASSNIDIRLSFKIIANEIDGTRPRTANNTPLSNQDVLDMVAVANDSLLTGYGRGYRFVVDEIVDIGSACYPCTQSDPSYWYSKEVNDSMALMESAALSYPSYQWSATAVNVYINWGMGNGGVSSFSSPPDAEELTVFGSRVIDPSFREAFAGALLHHELGHFFDLAHTQGSAACEDCSAPTCDKSTPGDDGLLDTLPDHACWSRDDLSTYHFGVAYPPPDLEEKAAIDAVYENNMSYHNGGLGYGQYILYRMTEDQLDSWTDTANDVRSNVRSGTTWFVDPGGSAAGPGASTSPYQLPQQAIDQANTDGGDIVLLRTGVYLQNITISKPLTLRATLDGPATVGF